MPSVTEALALSKRKERLLKQLTVFRQYFDTTRGVGHSTTMLEGATRKDCVIIGASDAHAQDLADAARIMAGSSQRPKSCGWKNIDRLRGIRAPLAVDNYALHSMLDEIIACLSDDEQEAPCGA